VRAKTGRSSRASEERRARGITWLLLVTAILRDRRFQSGVVFSAIALAAMAGLGREMNSRSFQRARDWLAKLDEQAGRAIKAPEKATADVVRKTARHG
jgi:hypothetical protein